MKLFYYVIILYIYIITYHIYTADGGGRFAEIYNGNNRQEFLETARGFC